MRRVATWCLLTAFVGTLPGAPAFAELVGERVVEGVANFEREGSHTNITTETRETIVDYDRFDVGVDESVRIDQPDAGSRILNRVPFGDASHVDGSLSSNGIVYILNPAGVFLGDRAIVDVGGLVAGAGVLSNEDFMAGVDRFRDVQGDVGVAAGASVRAAGDVSLIGRRVENLGSIVSEGGMIALVAGENVLLARLDGHVAVRVDSQPDAPAEDGNFALTQAGHVEAKGVTLAAGDTWSLAMNHTGVTRAEEIHVEAGRDGRVELAGTLDASSSEPGERGGKIHVQGGEIAVQGATLDASGEAGGGEILLGGDLRGGGDLPTARRVDVSSDSVLRADATGAGDGGKIIVYADEHTRFYGAISARGGAEGGDGGFAEISGAQIAVAGRTDLSAPQGRSGTVLIDPDKLVIRGGSAAPPPDDATTSFITEASIEAMNNNVVLEATHRIETSGTFDNDGDGSTGADDPGTGVVLIAKRSSLTIRTTGTAAPAPVDPDDPASVPPLGIDLTAGGNENLIWRTRESGNIAISTSLATVLGGGDTAPKASIKVGVLDSDGAFFHPDAPVSPQDPAIDPTVDIFDPRSISVSAVRGDIEIGAIEAAGEDSSAAGTDSEGNPVQRRVASSGADVTISTQQGDIDVLGNIQAYGGNAIPDAHSPGGNGATVAIATSEGNVRLRGDVDVHGGDGRGSIDVVLQGRETPVGFIAGGGLGGGVDVAAVGENDGVVRIEGDLIATGGDGVAVAQTGEDPVEESQGGRGGAISIQAQQELFIGSAGAPVLLEASGGNGSGPGALEGGGANARGGGAQIPPGFPASNLVQAIRFSGPGAITTGVPPPIQGQAVVHASLVARGGSVVASGDPPVDETKVEGGTGGRGGDVVMNLFSLDGSDLSIDVSGGKGDILSVEGTGQPPVAPNGLPFLIGGAGGGVAVVTASNLEIGAITAKGGDAHNGAAAVGGGVTLQAGITAASGEDPILQAADIVAGDIDTSGGNATRDAATGVAVPGGLGGGVGLDALSTDVGNVFLRGRIHSDRGTGVDSEGLRTYAQPNATQSVRDVVVRAERSIDVPFGTDPAGVVVAGASVVLEAPLIGTIAAVPIAGTGDTTAGADRAVVRGVVGVIPGNVPATLHPQVAVEIRSDDGHPDPAVPPAAPPAADVDAFERVELTLLDELGSARVTRSGGGELLRSAAADADSAHTLERFQTVNGEPFVSYRLDVTLPAPPAGSPPPPQPPTQPPLVIARGAIDLGTGGGEVINGGAPELGVLLAANRGDIVAGTTGTGAHATSRGTLRLEGRALGADTARLEFAGNGAAGTQDALRLDAQGAVFAEVTGAAFEAIDITQNDPSAGASVVLPGSDEIDITPSSDPLTPGSLLNADTTLSRSGFAYRLRGVPAAGDPNPRLEVESLRLGGDGLLTSQGELVLLQDTDPDTTTIETHGHALALGSLSGSVEQRGTEASIDMTCVAPPCGADRQLVVNAQQDIGALTPLVTSGVEHLAGRALVGSFVVDNDAAGAGALRIERVTPKDPIDLDGVSDLADVVGVSAGSAVAVTQRGTPLVLGEITDGAEFSAAHVTAGGNVTLTAEQGIQLENARFFETEVPVVGTLVLRHNDARIAAGGSVRLEGTVQTSANANAQVEELEHPEHPNAPEGDEFVHGSLQVEAGGTTVFTGNVGGTTEPQQLALLDVTNAVAEGDTRSFRVGDALFRGTLDGPAGVEVRAQDLSSSEPGHVATVTFAGDVGTRQAPSKLEVDAEHIRFTTADRVIAGAGGVRLDTNQSAAALPQAATIVDTNGLAIETSGAFATGDYDKFSVLGPLGIQASHVRVTDVNAARRLAIDAQTIEIVARAGGPLEQRDGSIVPDDGGGGLVADSIAFSSLPTIAADPAPVGPVILGVGSGGVSSPGNLRDFQVRRFTPSVDAVRPQDMIGVNGQILDLRATGRSVVGYPAEDMPRERPLEPPALGPRLGDSGPGAAPSVDAEQVLAFLRCGAPGAAVACDAAESEALGRLQDPSLSALGTQRAAELAAGYREMRSRDLSAVFDAAGADFRQSVGFGEFDAQAFADWLERSQDHAEARAAIHQLATLLAQVELLGLAAADEARVRDELANGFAFEVDLPGFDADAVLVAVAATPIGLPRQ